MHDHHPNRSGALQDVPELPPRRRFSDILDELSSGPGERVSVDQILNAFGDRALGALMLVFAAPNVIPLPPGASAILGAPLLFITAQLMLGNPVLWLPRFLRARSLSRTAFTAMTERLKPTLGRFERFLKPAWGGLLAQVQERLIGGACLLLAVVVFLPIPFGNMLPAFAIAAFALGIMEQDGRAVAVGWLSGLASLGLLTLVSGALIAAVTAFISYFGQLL